MIEITSSLSIDDNEVSIEFVRAGGPGGQNVNKVATAAQLRFNLRGSPSLPEDVRQRAEKLAGSRLTTDGVLVIDARRYRTQEQNRADALLRLVDLIRMAEHPPKKRRPTRPTASSQAERVESKKRHGALKQLRRTPPGE